MNRISLERVVGNDIAGRIVLLKDEDIVESFELDVAYEAVLELIENFEFESVLDVGSGAGEHAASFEHVGKNVTTLDPDPSTNPDVQLDFFDYFPSSKFDLVWCSHVLEHQRNIGLFIDKIIDCCVDEGLICISVPPEISAHFLVQHPNQFTAGLLIYHLILAGLDCKDARILTYGYNVSVIVRNKRHNLKPRSWNYDEEAIEFMPKQMREKANKNQILGAYLKIDWEPKLSIPPHINSGI